MAYRFFYPTLSIMGTWKGQLCEGGRGAEQGLRAVCSRGRRSSWCSRPNSDTPYAGLAIDLNIGPMVVQLPPGPLMSAANDMNQLWVMDLGLPGPDKGTGGGTSFFRRATRARCLPATTSQDRRPTACVILYCAPCRLPDKTPERADAIGSRSGR
jgi:hypothetical protein